jgi:hypothetical protein
MNGDRIDIQASVDLEGSKKLRTMLERYQGILEMMQPDNGEAANWGGLTGRKRMDWLNGKTSIAGIEIPNLGVILGAAVIVILLIYTMGHWEIQNGPPMSKGASTILSHVEQARDPAIHNKVGSATDGWNAQLRRHVANLVNSIAGSERNDGGAAWPLPNPGILRKEIEYSGAVMPLMAALSAAEVGTQLRSPGTMAK